MVYVAGIFPLTLNCNICARSLNAIIQNLRRYRESPGSALNPLRSSRPLTNPARGHLNSYGTSSNCVQGKVTLVVVAYNWTWVPCLWSYARRSEPAQDSAPRSRLRRLTRSYYCFPVRFTAPGVRHASCFPPIWLRGIAEFHTARQPSNR